MIGRAHEHLGDRAAAARYLDRAAARPQAMLSVLAAPAEESWAQGAGAVVLQVRRLLSQGRAGQALALAGEATRRYPGSADFQRLAGDTALLAGDPLRALAQYARAAEIRRDYALVERLVTVLRMTGHERDALMLLTDHVALNPRDPAGFRLLGRLLAQQGHSATSAAILAQAGSLGGDGAPPLLADRANVELALGDVGGAVDLALRAHALQRSNQRAAAVLARALEASGGNRQAEALAAKGAAAGSPPTRPGPG
jgi:tetratricopeptide (TPR) repeat protein